MFAAEAPLSIDLSATVWNGDLDVLIKHRAIRVLVPYSKTLFFIDYGGTERGMSYDFMHAFEDALNKQLNRGNLRSGGHGGARDHRHRPHGTHLSACAPATCP